jgi:shikimate kinase
MEADRKQPDDPLNVVLIGFMGCGKSTLGPRLAEKLGFRFVDTDALVVRRAGRAIPAIFAEEGEAGFRRRETAALDELLVGKGRLVIATGGGIVTVPDNLAKLKRLGCVIWLDTPEAVIWERVSRNHERPLLRTENPRETVRALLEARRPLYRGAADIESDSGDLTPDEAAYGLAESVRLHFAGWRGPEN